MTSHLGTNVGCQLVAEYVDEADDLGEQACRHGEVVRPRAVAAYLDLWNNEEGTKEFTVLLGDSRKVVIRGHSLKLFPPASPGDFGSYGVALRTSGEELLVALFRTADVVGIFSGELQLDPKTV